MHRMQDLAGKRFGRLTAVWPAGYRGKHPKLIWLCLCDCGNSSLVFASNLKRGFTQSCGCMAALVHAQWARDHRTKHGHARDSGRTREYTTWVSMWDRCTNAHNKFWHCYGGRGIKVCKRWKTFGNFLADMGPKPTGLTMDRIDNRKGYNPSNCKWTSQREQIRNRRPFSEWKVTTNRGPHRHAQK